MAKVLHETFNLIKEHFSVAFPQTGLGLVFEKNNAKIPSQRHFMSKRKEQNGKTDTLEFVRSLP